jgi:hypothetical protein
MRTVVSSVIANKLKRLLSLNQKVSVSVGHFDDCPTWTLHAPEYRQNLSHSLDYYYGTWKPSITRLLEDYVKPQGTLMGMLGKDALESEGLSVTDRIAIKNVVCST